MRYALTKYSVGSKTAFDSLRDCVVNLYEPEDVRDFFNWIDEVFSSNKGGN